VREVKEETGIDAEFVGLVAFRHMHGYRFGGSDMYFICLMRPTQPDQSINKCDVEIKDCKWIKVSAVQTPLVTTLGTRQFATK